MYSYFFRSAAATAVLLLLATALSAQNHPVSGLITAEAGGDPLEYATVSAYAAGDSLRLIDGTVTDAAGRFSLSLPAADYRLEFGFIGLATRRQTLKLLQATDLGEISLTAVASSLDAVEVTAERTRMSLQLDKKVFEVGQDALSRGGSATNVLEQLPSIMVSADGQVSLRGNSGVRILVNGRPSALADNNALEAIPAASIERVEIITNPSARYEAAGSAGIINIILKKEKQRGYGGTVGLTTGYPADHRLNMNLNLRREKFSAFASAGLRYSNYRGSGELDQESEVNDGFFRLRQERDQDRNDKNVTGYAGLDYNISERATLTAGYSLYHVINDDLTDISFRYTDADDRPTRNWRQSLDYLEPGTYQQLDIAYIRTGEAGKKLSLYLKNDLWAEVENEVVDIDETFPAPVELLRYRTETRESSRDHLLQADYEMPLGEYSKLELGLRGETRIITSDYLAENFINEAFTPLPGFANELDYFERIGSAYLQYGWKKDAIGLQVGLRNEYTWIQVESAAEEQPDIEKRYNKLFPSLSASYQLSDATSTQLSYSRRIRRPAFWQLNPFAGIGNPTTLFAGNPDLDPAYTDRVELNLVQRWEKLTVNPALYASTTTDFFNSIIEQEGENIFALSTGTIRSRAINLEREDRYGLEVTTNYRPTEKLTLSGEINYYGYRQRGRFGDRDFAFDFATWSGALRTQIQLPADIGIQARFNYNARYKDAQTIRRGQYLIDLGLTKQWNKKFTLTLNVRSPRFQVQETFRPDFRQEEYSEWTNWRTGLSLQYRFERGAGAEERRQRGSIR